MLFWDSYGITTTFNSCKTFQSSLTVARLYNFANELHIFGPTCENVFISLLLLVKEWILWDWVFEGLDLNLNSLVIFLSVEKTSQQLGEKYHNHCSVFGIWAMTFFSSKWCLAYRYNNNVISFFARADISLANFFYM